MMAHELLRQAALILGAGWSKGCDARDITGRIVPLHIACTAMTKFDQCDLHTGTERLVVAFLGCILNGPFPRGLHG
jgi:hypothetical protein